MTYQFDLYARKLVEERHLIHSPGEAMDAANYLGETSTLDFKSSAFRHWMHNHQLERRDGERDLDFAYRAFLKIRELGDYFYDANQDRRVSKTCSSARTDCGGLAALFASTMRANKIPARLLVGRWLKTMQSRMRQATTTVRYTSNRNFTPKTWAGYRSKCRLRCLTKMPTHLKTSDACRNLRHLSH